MKNNNTQKIIIDWDDSKNTQPINNSFSNFKFSDFYEFSIRFIKYVSKSWIMWILIFLLPMFTMFFDVLIMSTNSFDESLEIQTNIATSIISITIITPFVLLGLLVLPSFLITSRENGTFKRMIMIGIRKENLYYFYLIFSSLFTIVSSLFLVFPWFGIITSFVNNSGAAQESVDNPWIIFKFIHPMLFVLIILITIPTISSIGYSLGMKTETPRKQTTIAIGYWIFISTSSSFLQLFPINILASNFSGDISKFGLLFLKTLFLIFKWMFAFTTLSLLMAGITISFGIMDPKFRLISENIVYYDPEIEKIILIIIFTISLIIGIIRILMIFLKRKELLSLEMGR